MYKILTFNNISPLGLDRFSHEHYEVASEFQNPDAVMLRSYNLHEWSIPDSLKAVGRAGAGVNNIPLDKMNARGIPVFNAPGANANAVKELVLASLFVASRNLFDAWDYTRQLQANDDAELSKQVEAGKKKFVGHELHQRTLGVIGLGAIGVKVANAAVALGMRVFGYDPHITVRNAWQLSSNVQQAVSVTEVVAQAEFITLHVPLVDATRHLIDQDCLARVSKTSTLLNFSRSGIVDEDAVCAALESGSLKYYVCDFPNQRLLKQAGVINLPHLGASTQEAEENCAVMVADQLQEFLEHGTVRNSVNFPEMDMPRTDGYRLMVVNANVPHMIERISSAIANVNINILDLLNKSRGDIACTLVDTNQALPESVLNELAQAEGVLSVRTL